MGEQQRDTLGMVSLNRRLSKHNRGNTIAHRVAREDPIHRNEEQQRNTLGMVSSSRLLTLALSW